MEKGTLGAGNFSGRAAGNFSGRSGRELQRQCGRGGRQLMADGRSLLQVRLEQMTERLE
jgi:hypothetical protein